MSDPGPRAWLRVLVEESSYISGSKKGSIGRCQWSELEPISELEKPLSMQLSSL